VTVLRSLYAATLESPTMPISSPNIMEFLGGDASPASGKKVTEEGILGLPAVWRAINVISGSCASLPLHAYKPGADSRERLTSGQAATLLEEPHPDMTPFELWETVYAHIGLWGNAYLQLLRDEHGRIAELWPIHPGRVKVGRTSDAGTKVFLVDGKLTYREFTSRNRSGQILHIPGFGYDGVCGVSPVRAARMGLGLALAAEEYGARLFGSGSLATGILQSEQRLTQDQADAIQARWRAKRTGLSSSHEVIVLDSGAKFHQLSIPPADAQFLESRRFQVTEIARMFGVPPHMLMDTEKSTSWGTGIEQQSIGFVVFTLRPWLIRVEQRVSRLLRPEAAYAKYSVEGLLRGDSTQRATFYQAMWNLGVFSTNEIRALEERPPVENGDTRYRPLNMGELGTSDSTAQETSNA
jgi:HK97 family phage portal protein